MPCLDTSHINRGQFKRPEDFDLTIYFSAGGWEFGPKLPRALIGANGIRSFGTVFLFGGVSGGYVRNEVREIHDL